MGGSRKKAVAILGISERTLRYKLSQYRAEGYLVGGRLNREGCRARRLLFKPREFK